MKRYFFHCFLAVFMCQFSTGAPAQTIESYNTRRVISDGPKLRLQPVPADGRLEDIQQSLDGTRLITHDRSFAPKLWDTKTMTLLRVLGSRTGPIKEVYYSNSGTKITTLTKTEIQIWDAKLARSVVRYVASNGSPFTTSTMNSAENQVAVGCEDGSILLLNLDDFNKPKVCKGQKGEILDLAFSADGATLASGSKDKTVGFYNTKSFDKPKLLVLQPNPVNYLQYSDDNSQLLITTTDMSSKPDDENYTGEVRLYNSAGKMLWSRPHTIGRKGTLPNTAAGGVFVLPNQVAIMTMDKDGTMRVFDRKTFKERAPLTAHTAAIRELRVSKNGKFAATYGNDEALHIFDIETGKVHPTEGKLVFMGGPTAGEFSQTGDIWWLGYQSGLLQEYKMSDGSLDSATMSSQLPLSGINYRTEPMVLEPIVVDSGFRANYSSYYYPIEAMNESLVISGYFSPAKYSPNGQYGVFDFNGSYKFVNLDTMRFFMNLNETTKDVAFTKDGTAVITTHDKGKIIRWKASDISFLNGVETPFTDDGSFRNLTPNTDGSVVAFTNSKDVITVINMENFNTINIMPLDSAFSKSLGISPDGKSLIVSHSSNQKVYCFDILDGQMKWEIDVSDETMQADDKGKIVPVKYGVDGEIYFTKDGSSFALGSSNSLRIIDTKTGRVKNNKKISLDNTQYDYVKSVFSPDGNQYLVPKGLEVQIFETATDKLQMTMPLQDIVTAFTFMPKGDRILTTDRTGGITIFANEKEVGMKSDIVGMVAKQLGNFVMEENGNWLALDTEGRYDATDPSTVDGAAYIFEWSEGLEPIEVSQFKSQFYEPNLLAKMLGLSKEPTRNVPSLEDLKLFPELSLTVNPKNSKIINIGVEERDNGGIGTLIVSINGKQVLSKRAAGFQQLDLNQYEGFFLPESVLGEGNKNVLTATISNLSGTLTSMPISLKVETPNSLKTPAVKMYGLFVGVGDYVGDKKDLVAPPKDAISLGKTLNRVSENLLPNNVEVTTMASGSVDAATRPTKINIVNWFKTVSKKASSSDIVFVFMAGHGTGAIGEQKDYFFLTSDIDPLSLDALAAKSGAISGEELRGLLSSIPASKQVVVLDTCHSGAAAESLLGNDRSVSADFARAYESIRDSSGTWMLAGSAADQLSYESPNVEHGLLSYSLLEAIDKEVPSAMREGSDGKQFLDVERWLTYAATRVESLKNEVGLKGVQKPEFKRSKSSQSFDVGLTTEKDRGMVGLRPPMPIVIVGTFSMDEEDPSGIELLIDKSLRECTKIKPWFDVPKHPNVYRVAGNYELSGDKITLKLIIQKFDQSQQRKTIKTVELIGSISALKDLGKRVRETLEAEIPAIEAAAVKSTP